MKRSLIFSYSSFNFHGNTGLLLDKTCFRCTCVYSTQFSICILPELFSVWKKWFVWFCSEILILAEIKYIWKYFENEKRKLIKTEVLTGPINFFWMLFRPVTLFYSKNVIMPITFLNDTLLRNNVFVQVRYWLEADKFIRIFLVVSSVILDSSLT